MTQHTDLPSDLLPTTEREFFAAHVVHDADTASSFLTEDAVVVDQGETFRGPEEIHAFLRDAGSSSSTRPSRSALAASMTPTGW